jgi:hypothetical protein
MQQKEYFVARIQYNDINAAWATSAAWRSPTLTYRIVLLMALCPKH